MRQCMCMISKYEIIRLVDTIADKKILLRRKALSIIKRYFKIEPIKKGTMDKDLKKKLKSLGYI